MSTRRTTTIARADAEVAARLRLVIARLARTVRQHAAAGLTPSQLSALASIEEHGPIRMSDLAAYESVGASVATRVVDSLEKLDYVARVSDATDRRACLIELTDAGRRVLQELWHARATVLIDRIGRLTPAQSATLVAALPVLEALVRDADAG
jgi:DNA-binding MarR family transcriptional regulator